MPLTFADFIKAMQAQIDNHPGFLHTECNLWILTNGDYIQVENIFVDVVGDLIISTGEENDT